MTLLLVSGGVNSGEVAPYIDIDLVFVADARCIRPESLETQNSETCKKCHVQTAEVALFVHVETEQAC